MFKIGQLVVCIDDSTFYEEPFPKERDILKIDKIKYQNGICWLGFIECYGEPDNRGFRSGFNSKCFRPVTYISDSEFEELEKELNKEEYAKI